MVNCPSCGAHVPAQKKFRAPRPANFSSRVYKRVWMRARRRGITFESYVAGNLALNRAGKRCDRDVLELPMPERRSA